MSGFLKGVSAPFRFLQWTFGPILGWIADIYYWFLSPGFVKVSWYGIGAIVMLLTTAWWLCVVLCGVFFIPFFGFMLAGGPIGIIPGVIVWLVCLRLGIPIWHWSNDVLSWSNDKGYTNWD